MIRCCWWGPSLQLIRQPHWQVEKEPQTMAYNNTTFTIV